MAYFPHANAPGPHVGVGVLDTTDVADPADTPASSAVQAPGARPTGAQDLGARAEWQACYSMAVAIEAQDEQALDSFRQAPLFRRTLSIALESDAAAFIDRLYPGVRHELQRWLSRGGPTPGESALPALFKFVALLSVQEDGDRLRPKTTEERRADSVLLNWASSPSGDFVGARRKLAWELVRMHHDGTHDLRDRLRAAPSRCLDRLEWGGVLTCMGRLLDPAAEGSTRHSRELNQRLVGVLDAVMADDGLALACAAHTNDRPGDPPRTASAHLEEVAAVVGYLGKVPGIRRRPPEGWESFGLALQAMAAAGGMSKASMSGADAGAEWAQAWRTLTIPPARLTERRLSTVDGRPPLPERLLSSASARALSRSSSRSSDWWLRLVRQDSGASGVSSVNSVSGGPGSAMTRQSSTSSSGSPSWTSPSWSGDSLNRSVAPLNSLNWLPPVGAEMPRSPDRAADDQPAFWPHALDAQGVADLARLLDRAGALPLPPLAAKWHGVAQATLASLAARPAGEGGPTLGADDIALVRSAILRLMRLALDRVSAHEGADSKALRPRGEKELAALRDLGTWAAEARGPEAARRDRWIDVILDRAMNPAATPTIPAALLLQGAELPPWPAVRGLVNGDRVKDMATLDWKGEALEAGGAVSRLLEGLGIRHIEMPMSAIGREGLPEALGLDCMSAATLRLDESPSREQLALALGALEKRMRSLYVVRLVDRQGAAGISGELLPRGWDADPGVAGRLVHLGRDLRRESMSLLRTLWPERRMPPSLRSAALNTRGGGVEVLSYLGQLRQLRRAHEAFEQEDIEMLARLDTVIEGMARDEGYTAHCEHMVIHAEGRCADAGMGVLAAMSALRDVTAARTPREVAVNAFVQACLGRADALRAERRVDFLETLEDAMVLRWFVSAELKQLLGERVMVSPKPMFGRIGEGSDWDTPARSGEFSAEAMALIRAEVEAGFPGVVMLVNAEGPMGDAFRQHLDVGPVFAGLDARAAAAQSAYAQALEDDEDEATALERSVQAQNAIRDERSDARMAAMRVGLDDVRARILGVVEADAEGAQEPPAKRARH